MPTEKDYEKKEEDVFDYADTELDAVTRVTKVQVKVPPFWTEQPEIWFAQIEAQFSNAIIKTDLAKFNTVVASIESNVLSQVRDAILTPPECQKYENLKKKIIECYSVSQQKKMNKLLSDLDLGDRKPSQLLNEMRHLGPNVDETMLKTLWMQRLPMQIRSILSASDESLSKLAMLADIINEVAECRPINEVKASTSNNQKYSSSSSTSTSSTLEMAIANINKRLDELT